MLETAAVSSGKQRANTHTLDRFVGIPHMGSCSPLNKQAVRVKTEAATRTGRHRAAAHRPASHPCSLPSTARTCCKAVPGRHWAPTPRPQETGWPGSLRRSLSASRPHGPRGADAGLMRHFHRTQLAHCPGRMRTLYPLGPLSVKKDVFQSLQHNI